jgi:hypothetical protein
VGWMGTQGGQVGGGAPLVTKADSSIKPVSNTAPVRSPAVDVQDYLPAHKQLPYRPVSNPAQPATATR